MTLESIPGLSRYLYEHARDIILVLDAESGEIVAANRAAEAAYGRSEAELCACTVFDLRAEAEIGNVRALMAAANTDGVVFETVHRRADGVAFPVEVSSRGAVIDGRRALVSIIRDISERRRLEGERAQLLATTQHALALRDEFLLVASHELRTPVANAGLQLQALRRVLDREASAPGGAAIPERVRVASEAASREMTRLATLIDALLSAQHERDLELHVVAVDIGELVGEVVARLAAFADQAGIAITAFAPRGVIVRGDRVRLDQLIANLVTNALKYGARRPVEVHVRPRARTVEIDVVDRGIGIASDDAARIFGKFERAVPSGHYAGFGLGLYIARRIAVAHGGALELVGSEPAAGSTFRVTLPLPPVDRI